jgi:hypothetical protein
MSTTKADLAGLGTTGILIASVLALMVVGTGFVAFRGLSDVGSPSRPLQRVVVEAGLGPEAGRRAPDREESSLRPLPIPAPAGDVLRRLPPPLAGLPDAVEGGAPDVVPPGLSP